MPNSSASATRPATPRGRAKSLSERRAREDEIQRQLGGAASSRRAAGGGKRLAPLEALPSPPEGWRDEVQRLQDEAIRLAAQKEDAERAIRALEDQLEGIDLDQAALRGRGSRRSVARAAQPLRQRRGHSRAPGRTRGQARCGRRHPAPPRPRRRGRTAQAAAAGAGRGRARGADRRALRRAVQARGGERSGGSRAKRA